MYELWKVIKRNPGFYNPRNAGLMFLGISVFSIAKTAWDMNRLGYVT